LYDLVSHIYPIIWRYFASSIMRDGVPVEALHSTDYNPATKSQMGARIFVLDPIVLPAALARSDRLPVELVKPCNYLPLNR